MATIIRLSGDAGHGIKVDQDVDTVVDLWRSSDAPLGLTTGDGNITVYVSPTQIAAVQEVLSNDARERLSALSGSGPASVPASARRIP